MTPTRRLAATGLLAAAGAAALPAGRSRAQTVAQLTPPDEPTTQIDTAADRFEHMLAPVTINGQGPFRFLMDTGANISCVSPGLAQRLMLTQGEPAQVHTVVGVQSRPSVVIDHLQVGSRNRKAVRAPALPINSAGVDGVLGIDWLKGQRLTLDFKRKNLEISRSRSDTTAQGSVVVPARKRMGQLTIVDADMSGRRISAMVDSGSQVTICNTPLRKLAAEMDRRSKGPPTEPRRVKLESLAGEAFTGEMFALPFLRLGGLHLGNVTVFHADLHVFKLWELDETPALILGMDLLTQFNAVALDFGRSQVRFDFT